MIIFDDKQLTEQTISELVRRFYEGVAADESLQAIFNAAIQNWNAHHQVVENFWSRTLLDTDRYRGSPYPLHARLPLQPEHIERWLTIFRETALESLPLEAAHKAIAQAEHMAESFKAGMFTVLPLPRGSSRSLSEN